MLAFNHNVPVNISKRIQAFHGLIPYIYFIIEIPNQNIKTHDKNTRT